MEEEVEDEDEVDGSDVEDEEEEKIAEEKGYCMEDEGGGKEGRKEGRRKM